MRIEKRALIATLSVFCIGLIFLGFQNCTVGPGFKPKLSSATGSSVANPDGPPSDDPPIEPPPNPCGGGGVTHAGVVAPFIRTYCFACHSNVEQMGGFSIEPLLLESEARYNTFIWDRMILALQSGAMPQGNPKPASCEIEALIAWKAGVQEVTCPQNNQPGRVTLRRHSNWEYDNTINDLTGLNLTLGQSFLGDGGAASFDHVGEAQFMNLPRLEGYFEAAVTISNAIMADSTARTRLLICSEQNLDCAKRIVENFGRYAYRRPPTMEETARLTELLNLTRANGDSFEAAIKLMIQAILISPNFLYHSVFDYSPAQPGQIYNLNAFEIATRISYFLWGTGPDQQLLQVAMNGTLMDRNILTAQVDRMMASSKFEANIQSGFGDQWLGFRQFEAAIPDLNFNTTKYPEFSQQVATDSLKESRELWRSISASNRKASELITSPTSFINDRLATFYGIPGVTGTNFRPVDTTSANRIGLLSHASTSLRTSTPNEKSIVRRGLFIMREIACTDPGPPPPDAGTFDPTIDPSLPQRQRLAIHSQNAACNSCHRILDNYGFSLERFNAIGKIQTMEGSYPVDSTGVMPDGRAFNGVQQFAQRLIEDGSLNKCVSKKMITFATGRVPLATDQCTLGHLSQQIDANNLGVKDLVRMIATNELVLKSKSETTALPQLPALSPPTTMSCDLSGKITWDSGAGTKTISDQHWSLSQLNDCKTNIRTWLDTVGCASGGVNRATSVIDMPYKFYETWGRVRGSCSNISAITF